MIVVAAAAAIGWAKEEKLTEKILMNVSQKKIWESIRKGQKHTKKGRGDAAAIARQYVWKLLRAARPLFFKRCIYCLFIPR